MSYERHVRLVETGPRDGLQYEPKIVATEIKLELIDHRQKPALREIEAT